MDLDYDTCTIASVYIMDLLDCITHLLYPHYLYNN